MDKSPTKVTRGCDWNPPMDDDLMFSVDGSANRNPTTSGVGGVLRDARGRILCLFLTFMGILDSNVVEIYAIHTACQLIASKPLFADRNVMIVSDSKAAVS